MPVDVDGGWTIPRFIAESHVTGTAISTGFTVANPTGIQVGDYMLMFLVTNKDTITKDSAFALIRQDLDSGNPWSMAVYDRTADSTDVAGTTYTWSCSGTTNAPNTAVIMAYRGVDPNNITFLGTGGRTYTSGTTNPVSTPSGVPNCPSLLVTGNGTRMSPSSAVATWTGTGNERFDGGNFGTVSYQHAYYDSGTPTFDISSSQGANSITQSTNTALTDRMSYTVALGARKVSNIASPGMNLYQALDRSTRW